MYELIEHRRLDGAASSITFSSIPQNYSDLAIFVSTRINEAGATGEAIYITLNGSTANFTNRYLQGTGSSVENGQLARYVAGQPALLSTANTFGNGFIHIANYSGGTNKIISSDSVSENNGTTAYQVMNVNLWSNTAPITEITLVAGTNDSFVANSSATLYGVNRRAGIGRAPLAMGGYMSYSNGYWVHTFPSSGSFIPFTNMDVEYLVVAGGGSGGNNLAGGGGGGGALLGTATGLTAGTNYTVTIGAGGARTSGNDSRGSNGNNSVFSSFTATGGGGGGSLGNGNAAVRPGADGGSGGGGAGGWSSGIGGAGGTGTSGQGFNGGVGASGTSSTFLAGGGGGGAGGPGGNGISLSFGGDGGQGLLTTFTGNTAAYAGGGGGGVGTGNTGGVGGLGGGGRGGIGSGGNGVDGTSNTGGGGGGGGNPGDAGNGGSGIVIVRYKA